METATKKGNTTVRAVHFHSSDERFCGARGTRRFTLDPNAVTCGRCMARDRFVLSHEATEYVRSLEAR